MPRKPPNDDLILEAARLYYEGGLDQAQVAKQIQVSRSYVSRLLTEARQNGLVEIRVRHPLPVAEDLQDTLAKRFGLQEARVLALQDWDYPETLKRLGALAARFLESALRQHDRLGIGWGTAIHATVQAFNPHRFLTAQVIQMIGGLGATNPEIDGTDLARRLAEKLGGPYRYLQAPLVVESATVCAALMRGPSIKEVLALARKARLAVIGIGTINKTYSSLLRAGFVTEVALRDLEEHGVVGDVCCRHYDLSGRIVDVELNERVVGIDIKSLKRIPCIVGVAGGIAKAPAILGALRGHLVNVLITDDRTAREVLRLDDESHPSST